MPAEPASARNSSSLGTKPSEIIMARGARRICDGEGGPEEKLRGRPPPPVEPRSGHWRRTGSESGAGRARTRHQLEYDESLGMTTARRESEVDASSCNFR